MSSGLRVNLLGVLALALAPALLLPGTASATHERRGAPTTTGETAPAPPLQSTAGLPEEPTGPGPRGERDAGREGGCHIDIDAEASRLAAGESATLSGSLSCPTSIQASERTITIYRHEVGTPGAIAVGTTTSSSSGAYGLTTEPLDASSVFFARSHGARSARVSVKVAPVVTIDGPPVGTQLYIPGRRNRASGRASDTVTRASNTVTFTGQVSPVEAGARVTLQREGDGGGEDWSEVALGEVDTNGAYSITHTFTVPGTIDVRAVVRRPGLLPGVSEPISYELAHPQNPQLTIEAKPRPLSYGEPVIVSGTAAGETRQPLTLLASTRGEAFAPLATTTTGSGGSYSFPAQSPVQDTVYRVSDAHTSSTSLSEGVHPVVAAEASATHLLAGEGLKLTGTIAPAHVGQPFELQRQNPDGLGFHVVEVGTLGTGGAFSIEHTVIGAGTQAFRIKIPGDAEVQGAASELLEVQVTPASGPSLEPQAPVSETSSPGES